MHTLDTLNTCLGEVPTSNELTLLKYTEKGEKKKLNIIEEASHKWKDIASLICDGPNKVNVLEQNLHGNTKDCLRQVFTENFIEKKPQGGYSQDWNGMIELLDDVGLEALAAKVKFAISC